MPKLPKPIPCQPYVHDPRGGLFPLNCTVGEFLDPAILRVFPGAALWDGQEWVPVERAVLPAWKLAEPAYAYLGEPVNVNGLALRRLRP
jgi:hypothetical protein